jgi:cysteine synthase B
MLHTIQRTDNRPIGPKVEKEQINTPTDLGGQVGNTPLLHLKRISSAVNLPATVQLYAKAEWFNPSGSIKDRPALNIIRTAESMGLLRPGMTLLDSTSGNMGIAYAMFGAARGYRAMFGAARGYRVKPVLLEHARSERIAILRAYGAELLFTDPLNGSDGAMVEARRLAEDAPETTYFADQYNNPANWQAHYFTTANEIWKQSGGQLTHFVAGLGTSGTFVGTSRRLKELNPYISCVSMQPESPLHGLEGLKHMATSNKPGIYDPYIADASVRVQTEDAFRMARELAKCEGLFVGVSAAAAIQAALNIARDLTHGMVVTVLPDNGYKYVTERFWDD